MRLLRGILLTTTILILSIVSKAQAPVYNDDIDTLTEDTYAELDVLVNDFDLENDWIRVSAILVQPNNAFALPGFIPTYNNKINWYPFMNKYGIDSLGYRVCDSNVNCADTAWVRIYIIPQDDPPVAVADIASMLEDDSILIPVMSNDIEVDGEILTLSLDGTPSNGSAIIKYPSIEYIPDTDFFGIDTFYYIICDSATCDTAEVIVNVAPINDAPVAFWDIDTVDEDQTAIINVLQNDTEPDYPIDTLSVSIWGQGIYGIASVNADQTINYTPNQDYNGWDFFAYEICDLYNECDTSLVEVWVEPINDTPNAVIDSVTIFEEGSVVLDVQGNDSDIDGDTLTTLIISPHVGVTTIIQNDDSILVTGAQDFNGIAILEYAICDIYNACDTDSIQIRVLAVNDAPLTIDDTDTTFEDSSLLIAVKLNDSDVDGDTLTLAYYSQASSGFVSKQGTQLLYTPASNFNGADQFFYTACDGNGLCDSADIFITVLPVNDRPIAVRDVINTTDTHNLIDVQNNDSDIDGDLLLTSIITDPEYGDVGLIGIDITYDAVHGFNGVDSFQYSICDTGLCDSAWVVITALTNDAPIAINDTISLSNTNTTILLVQANDIDPNGDPLETFILEDPIKGIALVDQLNISYSTEEFGLVEDTLRYEICDNGTPSLCDTASVFISIQNNTSIPTGFSPNMDGVNDQFLVRGLKASDENEFIVFDRWGGIIYKDNEFDGVWDGNKENGKAVLGGTYFYQLKIGNSDPTSGFVIIKR